MASHPPIPESFRSRLKLFSIGSLMLVALFAATLADLFQFCLKDDLFSYILWVPLVTAFLIHLRRNELEFHYTPADRIAAGLGAAALAFLLLSFLQPRPPEVANAATVSLCFRTISLVLGWIAVAVWSLGGRFMSGLVFPAAFLLFMTPLPPLAVASLEQGLQHASAEGAAWLFAFADIPFFRMGLSFQLPNVTIQVAPECSGIRSTLVLLITSLVAGHLLLERPWQRAALALLVIPLGIIRNAFRIVTLGWLCTHYGSEMIDSPIHHRGGPVFFVISLLPLFAMLIVFRTLGKKLRSTENRNPVLPDMPTEN